MNKTLLHLLVALSLALAALPGISQPSEDGDDFIAMQVPDLRQAVSFFHNVMNCNALRGGDNATTKVAVLLDCGRQTVIELTQTDGSSGKSPVLGRKRVTLNTDDATHIAAWLRANRVHLDDNSAHIAAAAEQGKFVVSFITPWGQPLELVSRVSGADLIGVGRAPAAVAAQ